jgi:predicted site-specific integrase-resolvase
MRYKDMYTLEEFSKLTGLAPVTLRKYDNLLKPLRTPGGHRRYTDEHLKKLYQLGKLQSKFTVIYARVSTKSQKKHLDNQVQFCEKFCHQLGIPTDNIKVITDIGSSVNFNRKGLNELLKLINYGLVDKVIVASKDRLTRIGFELIEKLCELNGVELIVISQIDNHDTTKDIVEELVHIVHYYAMKLYGSRSYKKISQLEKEVLKSIGEGDE